MYYLSSLYSHIHIQTDPNLSGPQSDWLSTVFDVGGILGESVTMEH